MHQNDNRPVKKTLSHTQITLHKNMTTQLKKGTDFRRQKFWTTADLPNQNKKLFKRKNHKSNSNILFGNFSKKMDANIMQSTYSSSKQLWRKQDHRFNYLNTSRSKSRNSIRSRSPTERQTQILIQDQEQIKLQQILNLKSLQSAEELTGRKMERQSAKFFQESNIRRKKQNIIDQLTMQSNKITNEIQQRRVKKPHIKSYTQINLSKLINKHIYKKQSKRQEFRVDLLLDQQKSRDIIQQISYIPLKSNHQVVTKQYKNQKQMTQIYEKPIIIKDHPHQQIRNTYNSQQQTYYQQKQVQPLNIGKRQKLKQPPVIPKKIKAYHKQQQLQIPKQEDQLIKDSSIFNIQNQNLETDEALQQEQQDTEHIEDLENIQNIKAQCQQLTSVGQIVGHGLKMLKGININWILPCIPIYQKFYQLRAQFLRKAQCIQGGEQFAESVGEQNQGIKKSFLNMLKSAQKKPITPSQISKLKDLKIQDKVNDSQIVQELVNYIEVVNNFSGKPEQLQCIKRHLIMVFNAVIKLFLIKSQDGEYKILRTETQNLDLQLIEGLNIIHGSFKN